MPKVSILLSTEAKIMHFEFDVACSSQFEIDTVMYIIKNLS